MRIRVVTPLLIAVLFVVPAATAGPQPALYFLKDGATGPVGEGILNQTMPDGPEPSARPVLVGTEELPSAVFGGAEPQGSRLYGPLFVAIWPGPSAVLDGNITAAIYFEGGEADGAIAWASRDIDFNESSVDPMTLIPPDPSDPEAAAAHVMAQALAMALKPPMLLDLGFMDLDVPAGSTLQLGLYLESGDAPVPIPLGAAMTLQYDGQLMPSFVYVPWYEPPEPSNSGTSSSSATGSPGSGSTGGSGGGSTLTGDPTGPSSGDQKDSPGVGLLVLLVGLAGAVALVRRRW